MISLSNVLFDIWKTKLERKGLLDEFHNVFYRFIGIEDESNYNDILKTLLKKIQENPSTTLYFENEISFEADFNFINNIKNELNNMNINSLSTQNIKMFNDNEINNRFLEALEYTVNLAIKQENFLNENIRNNFIVKMLLYTYIHILKKEIIFDSSTSNKVIYYGNIGKYDVYYLIFLFKFGFDVIYINPLKEDLNFETIDSDNLSILQKYSYIGPIETLEERAKKGNIIERNDSITLSYQTQLTETLFSGTGVFRPWQFRDGNTFPLFFNSTIIDLEQNWNQPAKVRQGFKVEDKTVYVPHFIWDIEGEYNEFSKYQELINNLREAPKTLFIKNQELEFQQYNLEDKYKLVFAENSDGTFNHKKLKDLDFYKYSPYNDLTEDFIINKINEVISDKNLFYHELDKDDTLLFVLLMLNLPKKIIQLIDSFDFTSEIPKVVFFLEKEINLTPQYGLLIAFLSKIGFDIVIFSPAGMSDLNSFIKGNRYNNIRLDNINYERTLSDIDNIKNKSKSFFGKFFS